MSVKIDDKGCCVLSLAVFFGKAGLWVYTIHEAWRNKLVVW